MGSVILTILHDDEIVKGFNIIIATVNVKWMLNIEPSSIALQCLDDKFVFLVSTA